MSAPHVDHVGHLSQSPHRPLYRLYPDARQGPAHELFDLFIGSQLHQVSCHFDELIPALRCPDLEVVVVLGTEKIRRNLSPKIVAFPLEGDRGFHSSGEAIEHLLL